MLVLSFAVNVLNIGVRANEYSWTLAVAGQLGSLMAGGQRG